MKPSKKTVKKPIKKSVKETKKTKKTEEIKTTDCFPKVYPKVERFTMERPLSNYEAFGDEQLEKKSESIRPSFWTRVKNYLALLKP